jgi:hypothetical protein
MSDELGYVDISAELCVEFVKGFLTGENVRGISIIKDAIPDGANAIRVEASPHPNTVRIWLSGVEPRAYSPVFSGGTV